MMEAWQELDRKAYDEVWERFQRDFCFQPSMYKADWPSIREPTPSEVYSISEVYSGGEDHYTKLNRELQDWGLRAFQALLTTNDEWINVLDWQHDCYRFFPQRPFELNEFNEWPIPILPNGDYFIFIHPESIWGIFGHPWEQTMCIFGEPLLILLKTDRPMILTQLVRRNGKKA